MRFLTEFWLMFNIVLCVKIYSARHKVRKKIYIEKDLCNDPCRCIHMWTYFSMIFTVRTLNTSIIDHAFFFNRPRAVSADSPRSPVGTPTNSIGELVPPGASPGAPKSPDVDATMPQFPAKRRESNEMSLEEEQLAGVKKGLLKLSLSWLYTVSHLTFLQ